MGWVRFVVAATAGYMAYRVARLERALNRHAAFAEGEADGANPVEVRNAGPAAMRSDMSEWDRIDEASDESFPASDPPALH